MEAEPLKADGRRRVEELLRINAELAAEVRSLQAGRSSAARSAAMPTARRVGKLREERDRLEAELEGVRAELEGARAELGHLRPHNEELAKQIHDQAAHIAELSAEVAALRGGPAGLLRRLRARLLRRRD